MRCESKKYKESKVPPPREIERPRRTAAAIANIQLTSSNPNDSFRAQNTHELVEV